MKNKLKLKSLLIASILLITFIAGGCGKSSASTSGGKGNLPKIRIGIITSGAVRPALVIAAKQLGYYEQEGVDVEFVTVDSVTSALAAITANKIDIFPYAIVPTLASIAQGSDLEIIGGTASEGSSLVKGKGSENVDFRDFNNWTGKKIGYSRSDTTVTLLRKYFESKGFDTNKAEWVEVDDQNARLEALKKGTIDASFLTEETLRVGQQAGLVEGFQLAEFLPNYICCRQTADKKRVNENRDPYLKVIKAQIRAQNDYKNNTSAVVKAVADYIEQDYNYVKDYIATTNTIDTGGLVQYKNPVSPDPLYNKIVQLYQVSKESGIFEEASGVNIKDHVDVSLFKDAVNELIKENPDDETYKTIYKLFERDNSDYNL